MVHNAHDQQRISGDDGARWLCWDPEWSVG